MPSEPNEQTPLDFNLDFDFADAAQFGEGRAGEGCHRGVLAGLTAEQRESATNKFLETHITDSINTLEILKEYAIAGAPKQTVAEALADLDEMNLQVTAVMTAYTDEEDLPEDLAPETVIPDILDSMAEPDTLHRFLTFSQDNVFDNFKMVAENGGRVTISADDPRAKTLVAYPPYIMLYYDKSADEFTAFTDESVIDLEEASNKQAIEAREVAKLVENLSERAAEKYGLISMRELAILASAVFKMNFPTNYLEAFIAQVYAHRPINFEIETINGETYVVTYEISDEFNLDAYGETPEGLDDYKTYLINRHKSIDCAPLNLDNLEEDQFEQMLMSNQGDTLSEWLNAHIPAGKHDFFFAERFVEQLYEITRGPVDSSDIPELIKDSYSHMLEPQEFETLLNLCTAFVNNTPSWENNGKSQVEMQELETGQKVFYNEDGSVKRVGRNEPCPCGSGKKYKKCCGA